MRLTFGTSFYLLKRKQGEIEFLPVASSKLNDSLHNVQL